MAGVIAYRQTDTGILACQRGRNQVRLMTMPGSIAIALVDMDTHYKCEPVGWFKYKRMSKSKDNVTDLAIHFLIPVTDLHQWGGKINEQDKSAIVNNNCTL